MQVIAHELSTALTSLRVTNVYDLSSVSIKLPLTAPAPPAHTSDNTQRIFLIKFHKPDHREQLLIDSGFRCHLTEYARTTAAAPSAFVAKLRKYLKTRRVTAVSQVGTDRILEFQFSDGLYRLYLEFYAGGNIVLTDGDLNILALLRNVEEGEEHEKLRVGLQYNLSLRQNYGGVPELTKERIRQGLQKAVDRQQAAEAHGEIRYFQQDLAHCFNSTCGRFMGSRPCGRHIIIRTITRPKIIIRYSANSRATSGNTVSTMAASITPT